MRKHPAKSTELVVYRTRYRPLPAAPCHVIEGTEPVDFFRILGVDLNSRLTMGDHITKLLCSYSSSTYALRVLRSQGLRPNQLRLVATTVAYILYGSPCRASVVGICK